MKLIDFGLSRKLIPGTPMKLLAGSPIYAAPEMMKIKLYDEKIDIWSSMVVIYALTYGKFPYGGSDWLDTLVSIESTDFNTEMWS